MTTTSEVLNRAADLIEERGWASAVTSSGEIWGEGAGGPLCLEGGIAAASGYSLADANHDEALSLCPAYATVWHYLQTDSRWSSRLWALESRRARPYDWNDAEGRTSSEVIEVLRACAVIEASRERESAEVVS